MKRSKTKCPSCIWKSLKVIQNNGEQVSISCIPKSLSLKGETIQDKQDIVNSFNEHFVNISNLISRPMFNSESFSHLKRSLSYLCPDLPSVVRKHYNRSLWLSSSCERASFKCNKAQVCKYADPFAQTHTYIRRSNFNCLCGRNHQRFQPDSLSVVP